VDLFCAGPKLAAMGRQEPRLGSRSGVLNPTGALPLGAAERHAQLTPIGSPVRWLGQCGIPPPFPVFAAGGHGLMAGIRGATIPKSSFEAGKNRAIGPGSSLARTIAFELPVGLPKFFSFKSRVALGTGDVPMSTRDDYRQNAFDCLRLAQTARGSERRRAVGRARPADPEFPRALLGGNPGSDPNNIAS
jgi:hypothetical protein